MSIIIKGMEMPKTCWDCACSNYYESIGEAMCDITDGQLDYMLWKCERHPDCPLIELPPHGRLIDADAIQDYNVETFGQRLLIIDTAPTVIEGSET